MAANLSLELKERIIRSIEVDALSQAETARRFAVAERTVSPLVQAYRERGSVAPFEVVSGPKYRIEDLRSSFTSSNTSLAPGYRPAKSS